MDTLLRVLLFTIAGVLCYCAIQWYRLMSLMYRADFESKKAQLQDEFFPFPRGSFRGSATLQDMEWLNIRPEEGKKAVLQYLDVDKGVRLRLDWVADDYPNPITMWEGTDPQKALMAMNGNLLCNHNTYLRLHNLSGTDIPAGYIGTYVE